jgi:hypothetical protein
LIEPYKLSSDDSPCVKRFCGLSGFVAQAVPQVVVTQYLNDRLREFRRVVTNQDVAPINGFQALTSDRGGYHSLTH